MKKYVFDTSIFINIFEHYHRESFPSFWKLFDQAIKVGNIVSVQESYKEIGDQNLDLKEWAKENKRIFPAPDTLEGEFVREIFSNPHFHLIIPQQKILLGGRLADPFIIAKAKIISATVVTTEKLRPHGAKIPNICQHFQIPCFSFKEFMKVENWVF